MLLQIDNLHVSYDNISALKGISLCLNMGEIVAIIGANGAGKTTLINTVSGLLAPKSGTIVFDGQQITGNAAWRIARRGIVQIPEGRKVFPKMSVEENLELGAYGENDARAVKGAIDEMYALFPVLKDRRRQGAGTLSGGEQQMLAIARGLMARPKLLMFDEPSMGLAPVIVDKVFKIIDDISRKGITILLVEQNARKSLQLAGRAYVLETGSIVLAGSGSELLENDRVKKAYLGA